MVCTGQPNKLIYPIEAVSKRQFGKTFAITSFVNNNKAVNYKAMKHFLVFLVFMAHAYATPILLNDQPLEPPLESRADLDAQAIDVLDERVPLGTLERFGITVQTSLLDGKIRMQLEAEDLVKAKLEWQPDKGWIFNNTDLLQGWNAPITKDGTVFVPIKCLRPLGFNFEKTESGLVIRSESGLPTGGLNQILEIRSSKGRSSRLTLSLARSTEFFVLEKTALKIRIKLPNTATQARFQAVGSESLSRVRVLRSGLDAILEAELPTTTKLEVSSSGKDLNLDSSDLGQPIPIPGALPSGVTYDIVPVGLSKLHLVRLETSQYRPEVQTAPWGGAKNILEYASGAVAAVNGSYFDPASMQPVDLLFNGALYAYSRGNRATIGFLDNNTVFGIPRARLVLTLGATLANINQIRPSPHPQNLTFFLGDGFVPVGGLGFTTFVIANGKILERRDDAFVPKQGQLTVSFNPKANPQLERNLGDPASVGLTWNDPAWQDVNNALAAGPRLIAAGQYAVNPQAEGFDPNTEIWRPTRQIGIGTDDKHYVLAMLEFGTPEDFARLLLSQGLRDAIRLDSGTSAQMALMGGAVGGRIGRSVPNALVFKAR